MEHLEAYNRKLLANILPVHVAEHFLNSDKNNDVSISDCVVAATILISSVSQLLFISS